MVSRYYGRKSHIDARGDRREKWMIENRMGIMKRTRTGSPRIYCAVLTTLLLLPSLNHARAGESSSVGSADQSKCAAWDISKCQTVPVEVLMQGRPAVPDTAFVVRSPSANTVFVLSAVDPALKPTVSRADGKCDPPRDYSGCPLLRSPTQLVSDPALRSFPAFLLKLDDGRLFSVSPTDTNALATSITDMYPP
jgi:hypothetical protein